jgi:dUTP pyrophosphatase
MRRFEIVNRISDLTAIKKPSRSTSASAGYDFCSEETITIPSIWKQIAKLFIGGMLVADTDTKIKPTLIKTGIKACFEKDEVLKLYNRSSNPIKRGLILANGVGVVDSDYYNNPDNDGEIMFSFYNLFPFDITIEKGEKIGQGVFEKFLVTDDDEAIGKRSGGFGSTGV